HTLVNSGAIAELTSLVNVTGNYSQSAGALLIDYGTGQLAISGVASVTGGTIAMINISISPNGLVGQTFGAGPVITGTTGSSYTGLTYNSNIQGMEITGSVANNSLYLVGLNDYVGTVLGSLGNSGTLSATNPVYVGRYGTLGTLNNTGVLSGSYSGVFNMGSIGTVLSTNSIVGTSFGLFNNGAIAKIDQISNSGTLTGRMGLANTGTITTLDNSGLLSGDTIAVYSTRELDTISNSGTIAGNISITGGQALTLVGGLGAAGLFTGAGGSVGVITNTTADLVLASGALQLNDVINVGSHTVANTGATVNLLTALSITGNYSQSAGTLGLANGAQLAVSGTASLTGGAVVATLSSTVNYLAGQVGPTLMTGG
ncbi:hypothetical protein, partial [Nitrospirillum amazonense]|uniref:hypothetical protein n=1 Tax=Nitrospirillum amazonense TaxID=28077 RepID=UPI001B3B6F76